MTPRTSVRAAAREIYGELARNETRANDAGAACGAPPPDAPDLMARVRVLYEDGVLPVRAIAAEVGVCERTIYKHAFRSGWRPRYNWNDGSACMRGRGWRAAGPYEPAKGGGGRFVRREDRDKPFARGLKATEPAARKAAQANCAAAARVAAEAKAEAGQWARTEALIASIKAADGCLGDFDRMLRDRPGPLRGKVLATQAAFCETAIGLIGRLADRWSAGELALRAASRRADGAAEVKLAFERLR